MLKEPFIRCRVHLESSCEFNCYSLYEAEEQLLALTLRHCSSKICANYNHIEGIFGKLHLLIYPTGMTGNATPDEASTFGSTPQTHRWPPALFCDNRVMWLGSVPMQGLSEYGTYFSTSFRGAELGWLHHVTPNSLYFPTSYELCYFSSSHITDICHSWVCSSHKIQKNEATDRLRSVSQWTSLQSVQVIARVRFKWLSMSLSAQKAIKPQLQKLGFSRLMCLQASEVYFAAARYDYHLLWQQNCWSQF